MLYVNGVTVRVAGFNPRPYVRGDVWCQSRWMRCRLFQSAPLREGRCKRYFGTSEIVAGFNPRPYVRGDDEIRKQRTKITSCFNPRPYVRGDAN